MAGFYNEQQYRCGPSMPGTESEELTGRLIWSTAASIIEVWVQSMRTCFVQSKVTETENGDVREAQRRRDVALARWTAPALQCSVCQFWCRI